MKCRRPDGQGEEHASPRFELIDDQLLVTPSPARAHQRAVLRIVAALDAYVATQGLGVVEISPADIQLTPDTIVQPDVFVSPLVGEERPEILDATLTRTPTAATEPLVVDLAALFVAITGVASSTPGST